MGTNLNYFTIISEENPANEVHDYVAKHLTDNKPFDCMTFFESLSGHVYEFCMI